jgi:hypothetical protein
VVLAINDRGYADHLHRVLAPVAAEAGALYFSTHALAPASDGASFVRDGHFTKAKNELLARRMAELVNARLGRAPARGI